MKSVYRKLKKVLMGHEGTIHISVHAKEQMNKRGYNKCDIALAIYNGKVVEKQYGKDLKMVIAGFAQPFDLLFTVHRFGHAQILIRIPQMLPFVVLASLFLTLRYSSTEPSQWHSLGAEESVSLMSPWPGCASGPPKPTPARKSFAANAMA